MTGFASDHRPKRFEDVVGQEVPVQFLSQLIVRGKRCRHVLLHGAVGSGKTTLARLYAQALNCTTPSGTGSPCGDCKPCHEVKDKNEEYFAELNAPFFRKTDTFQGKITSVLASAARSHPQVIFVDEAHCLSNGSFNYLLKLIEDSEDRTAFCFATTKLDAIPDAIQSRLYSFKLRPIPLSRSTEFLKRIAQLEGMNVEEEALALLWRIGKGQPRDMLHCLEQVSEMGDISRDNVRRSFGLSDSDELKRYFLALGEGDFELQSNLFFDWNESVRKKLEKIQLFMVSIYYNDLRRRNAKLVVDPLIDSILPAERYPIIRAFNKRVGKNNVTTLWEAMMRRWPAITADLSDESLLMFVTEFQRYVSIAPILSGEISAQSAASTTPLPDLGLKDSKGIVSPPRLREARIAKDTRYLSRSQVRNLFTAASFLVRRYGTHFNAQITIRATLFGCESQVDASKLQEQFNQALTSRLMYRTDESHWLCVREHSEKEGFLGRVIAVLPDRGSSDYEAVRAWLDNWRQEARMAGSQKMAITCEPAPVAARKLDAHWRSVCWLCAGLNPKDPIYEGLQIAEGRVAGKLQSRRRRSASDSLLPGKIERARQNHTWPLAAFSNGAWRQLYDEWLRGVQAD